MNTTISLDCSLVLDFVFFSVLSEKKNKVNNYKVTLNV